MPITSIKAHDSRIYGIDWDRRKRHKIVTCSLGEPFADLYRLTSECHVTLNRQNHQILEHR